MHSKIIVGQNKTATCKRVAVEDISIHPRKIILTEMNNHLNNSDFTISDVTTDRITKKYLFNILTCS